MNIIVNTPKIGYQTKYTNNAELKIFHLKENTDYIGQFILLNNWIKKILYKNWNFYGRGFFSGSVRSGSGNKNNSNIKVQTENSIDLLFAS